MNLHVACDRRLNCPDFPSMMVCARNACRRRCHSQATKHGVGLANSEQTGILDPMVKFITSDGEHACVDMSGSKKM